MQVMFPKPWREYLSRVMEHQKNLQADDGTEFFNSKFKVLMKS